MSTTTTPITLRSDERGIYFILLAIALVTILTLVGLGIDGSRLYINSLRQQRAADAASLSAAFHIGALTPAQIRDIARDVAQDNFDEMGVAYQQANLGTHFQVTYDPNVNNSVTVLTQASSESYIMGKVVTGAEQVQVAANAGATRVPLAITLVLDITGSMNGGVVDDNGNPRVDGQGNQITKLQLLQQAALNFVNAFDPTRDRIALVAYSFATVSQRQNGANPFQVLYPMTPDLQADFLNPNDTRNYDPAVIAQRVNGIPRGDGWTSIHGGLLTAFRETLRVRLVAGEPARKEVIVIVTDGAPNRDQRPDGDTSGDGGLATDLEFLPPGWSNPPAGSIGAGQGGNPQLVHPAYPAGCPADAGTNEYRDAYVEAILIADLIRQAGITLMTMAIGNLDPNEDPNSPNQSAWGTLGDHQSVKGTLMRRLANDAKSAQGAGDLAFPSVCADNFAQMSDMPAGIGLVSDDPDDFDNFLNEIANTILLRLTL